MLHTRLIKIILQLFLMMHEAISDIKKATSLHIDIARKHIYFWMRL